MFNFDNISNLHILDNLKMNNQKEKPTLTPKKIQIAEPKMKNKNKLKSQR